MQKYMLSGERSRRIKAAVAQAASGILGGIPGADVERGLIADELRRAADKVAQEPPDTDQPSPHKTKQNDGKPILCLICRCLPK
jgi:hypothetical protein